MKPCDCKDMQDVKKLDHSGIQYNDRGIEVKPNSVIITHGSCTLKVWQEDFRRWAEWYLQDQERYCEKCRGKDGDHFAWCGE